jgi:integration host factor subunit beta
MTRSELVESITNQQELSEKDVEFAVFIILEEIIQSMCRGERVEIRGFGIFSIHKREARKGRNPKSGEGVFLEARRSPHFKPGKQLRMRINDRFLEEQAGQ